MVAGPNGLVLKIFSKADLKIKKILPGQHLHNIKKKRRKGEFH